MINKKIAVLGGSGFIGRSLCEYLLKKNQVLNIDLKKIKDLKGIKNKILNINDEKQLTKVLKGFDYVFHFAGISDLNKALNNPKETAFNNILGTIAVLNACKKNRIKKIIYSSSLYSFTEEGGFYKCSKLSAEFFIYEYFKSYNLKFTILRFGSIYGKNSNQENGLFRIMNSAINNNKILYEGPKKAVRKFIYVSDVVKIASKSISSFYDNKILMITGKTSTRMDNLLEKVRIVTRIKKKDVIIKNKKINGHYLVEPKKFVFPKLINIYPKKPIQLNNGLIKLYNYIMKSYRKNSSNKLNYK